MSPDPGQISEKDSHQILVGAMHEDVSVLSTQQQSVPTQLERTSPKQAAPFDETSPETKKTVELRQAATSTAITAPEENTTNTKSAPGTSSQTNSSAVAKSDSQDEPSSATDSSRNTQPTSADAPLTHPSRQAEAAPTANAAFVNKSTDYDYTFPYVLEMPRKTTYFDSKQFANCLYFTVAICCVPIIEQGVRLPHDMRNPGTFAGICAFLSLVAVLALASFAFAFMRPKPSDFNFTFSPLKAKLLRTIALIVPIPLFIATPAILQSQAEYRQALDFVKANNYQSAKAHLDSAIALNLFNQPAVAKLAFVLNEQEDYADALAAANRSLSMRGRDSATLTEKAYAANNLGDFDTARSAAWRAIRLDNQNGKAFRQLAYAQFQKGEFEAALVNANRHLELHSQEFGAYTLVADILDALGRTEEANKMRELAEQYR